MILNGSGAIISIASYATFQALPTIAAYIAFKGTLTQLTRTLALEWPGMASARTPLADDVVTNTQNSNFDDGPAFLAKHGKSAPIAWAARPEAIAKIVAFLASDRASFFILCAVAIADGRISV